MVSYHHKSAQRMMVKVVRRLRQAGYKIWMDLDHMREQTHSLVVNVCFQYNEILPLFLDGSTLEAMALAIEKSCCVLVCMTQGYKDSPSCRTGTEHV